MTGSSLGRSSWKDETRNWGEIERELLLRTDAEVVIGWSAPDMCDSHTRTRQAKPADNAQSAASPRAKAKRHASTSSVRPRAIGRDRSTVATPLHLALLLPTSSGHERRDRTGALCCGSR